MTECQFCDWLQKHGRLKMGTFYYQDKREYTVQVGPVTGEGWLDVHAYADTAEVKASVEVVGVGTYETPFTIKVSAGTYTLNATYHDQKQTQTATVEPDKTTKVEFTFKAPAVPILWAIIAAPIIFGTAVITGTKLR
jgi:uncharacterized membrane protein